MIETFEVNQPQAIVVSVDNSTNYVLTVDLVTGGTPSYNYSWIDASGNVVGTGITYVVVNYGTYYVKVTDANGCVGISNDFTFSATSQIDLSAAMDLTIYPNPFSQETTIDFGREVSEAIIRVVDVFGKFIESYQVNDQNMYVIKRGDKASGVYFIEIEVEDIKLFNKVIIE